MRSYGQYCAIAKGLDVIGDRWNLLIVRELLLRNGSRYTDLRDGLPGIATNLPAERLRQLEEAGIVSDEEAPPPVRDNTLPSDRTGKGSAPGPAGASPLGTAIHEGRPGTKDELPKPLGGWACRAVPARPQRKGRRSRSSCATARRR